MIMLSQVTAFISDLKLGFKSSTKGSYKSRRRRQRDSHDDDDSRATSGCLGRSVSMEWGLASRRRRAKSTESLDRMSDHVRSAVSLMELTQATQAGPVGGTGAGTASSTTSDTWSSSNSSGHASSSNRRMRQQRGHDDGNRQPNGVGGGQSTRDQKRMHLLSGSTPNRPTNSRPNDPHQICLPPPPSRSTGSNHRRPSSLATPPTAFNSVPRQRSRRKNSDDPLTGRVPTQTPRKMGTDAVDGATVTPGSVRTSNPALNRIADAQTNGGGKLPLVRKILPLTVSSPVGLFPVSNGSASRRVEPKTEAQCAPRGLDGTMQTALLECVIDTMNGAAYYKGKLLGKGGFAKCYELNDIQYMRTYAGKIISKSRLTKDNQKDKILREVELHRILHHRNVVKFHSYFEDDMNVYIVLENCSRKSLVHVLKHRKTLTEPEVRYYMHHLVNGLSYIHDQHVIHRDLKLGNMLLNESMELKIADFGLATKVEYEGEKKMTVCGTPNYIAPEVLQKKGHSYEADIWALGCIMYALLCGRPPFETNTLKETYMRIVSNKFVLPPHVSMTARELICRLLTLEPSSRPPLSAIQIQDFFADGHFPTILSPSTCETRPKFPVSSIMPIRKSKAVTRTGSNDGENSTTSALAQSKGSKKSASQIITRNKTSDFDYADSKYPEGYPREGGSAPSIPRDDLSAERISAPGPDHEVRLYRQLLQSIEATSQSNRTKPEDGANGFGQIMTSSRFKPTVCVTKWVDYSNKYGFGFQLSNSSIGILFNDNMRMLLDPDGTTIELSDPNGGVATFTQDSAPEEHQKKVTLLLYFAQYMDTHLISGGQLQTKARYTPVFLKKWFRTDRAIVMFLTDGTLQVNFLEDHTKVIFNPNGAQDFLLTLVNSSRQSTTYPLKALRHFGCSAEVLERLRYACSMLERTINVEGVRV